MRRAIAALALAVLAACSASSTSGNAERTLRISSPTDLPTLDPIVSDNAQLGLFAPLFHGYLLRTDASGRFIPDLAIEVPSVRNGGLADRGLTIRYRLRRNARWHDGVPFDARDVVFSFHAVMNPRNNIPDRSGFDDVASVTARGRYDIVVRLRRPYSPGIATFFNEGANDAYPLVPAHLLAREADLNRSSYGSHPVGLGPYKVRSWQRGSKIELEADPAYFLGPAKIRRVDIMTVPDQNTELTLWRSGGLDVLIIAGFGASRSALHEASEVSDGVIRMRDHYEFNYVMFNVSHGALRELAVRRALVAGIDTGRLMRTLSGPFYVPVTGDRLPGQFAYDPSIRQPGYDPARARALLDAAGWRMRGDVRMREGVPLTLDIVGPTGNSLNERFMVALQSDLGRLGIRASVKPYQYNLLFQPAADGGIYAGGRFDLTYYGWQPGEDNDHSYLFRCDSQPPQGENYGRICDPAIDAAAALELTSNDPVQQARGDRTILRRLEDRADLLFLGFDRQAVITRNGIAGVAPSILGQHYWNVHDWYWSK